MQEKINKIINKKFVEKKRKIRYNEKRGEKSKMKRIKLDKIIFTIIMFSMIICIQHISRASSFGSVDQIDENKYPGFKEQLKQLQATYPNITVLYTGLDWNDVINNEHKLVHGRNLVYTTQSNEWICQECKNSFI